MAQQGPTERTRPVPGGKSQKGATRAALPRGGRTSANVGRGRGIVGGGTPDLHGRAPRDVSAGGNYGGGYAGNQRKGVPSGARKRG